MIVSLDTLTVGARAGKLVSFPTDTVPALASLPSYAELIYTAKQRSQDKPLILMGASASDLWSFVTGSEEEYKIWQEIAHKYWPGALTLVLPASALVPDSVLSISQQDVKTIGIRVPNSAIAQTILQKTGPLATTSANISGQPPLLTMAEIETQFPNVLTLEISEDHNKISAIGLPSTVAKWTGKNWQILRQGAVNLS